MYKKIITVLFVLSMVTMMGCGKDTAEDAKKDTVDTEASEEVQGSEESIFDEKWEEPEDTESEDSQPENSADEVKVYDKSELDYEKFQNLSPTEQRVFTESFDSIELFFEWYNEEKEKYEKEHPPIEVDGTTINLDEIVNGEE